MSKSGDMSDLPANATVVKDSVGAGDAYTAALVVGLLNDLPLEAINAWAMRVASFVCTQSGATPNFPAHLRNPAARQ